jgi:hypothetical protein
MLDHMARLVAQDAHAVRDGSALDIDDHLALQPHQARMGEIEGNRDAGRGVRAEPFVGDPGVGADAQPLLLQLAMQGAQAQLQPGPFDGDLEVLEAQFEEFLVRQRGPGKPRRHGAPNRVGTTGAMVSRGREGGKRGRIGRRETGDGYFESSGVCWWNAIFQSWPRRT